MGKNKITVEPLWLTSESKKNEVLEIESKISARSTKSRPSYIPWNYEELLNFLRRDSTIMGVKHNDKIIGYVAYQVDQGTFKLHKIAVDPEYQGQGIGTQLILDLSKRLRNRACDAMTLEVDERNLEAQFFLQQHNFIADGILRGDGDQRGEDRYLMRYESSRTVNLDGDMKIKGKHWVNRVEGKYGPNGRIVE